MLDRKLRPWLIEVNHTPSFNADTGVDADIKNDLIQNCLEIVQLSIEQRRKVSFEMRREAQQNLLNVKRPTAKEHSDRVRFDPGLVGKHLPDNGFRLIYPADAPGEDPDLYLKI